LYVYVTENMPKVIIHTNLKEANILVGFEHKVAQTVGDSQLSSGGMLFHSSLNRRYKDNAKS